MKIHKPGNVRNEWPVGVQFVCEACGCEFELQRNDLLMNWQVLRTGHMQAVIGNCPQPGCNHRISVERVEQVREVA